MNKQISILILSGFVSASLNAAYHVQDEVTPVKKPVGTRHAVLAEEDHDAPTPVHSVTYRMRSSKQKKIAETTKTADGAGAGDRVRPSNVRTSGAAERSARIRRECGADTRLHNVVRKGNCGDIVKLMEASEFDGTSSAVGPCDVNGRDPFGYTALYHGVKKNKLDVVQLLVEGYNADTSLTFDGLTLLDLAIEKGHAAIAKFLSLYIPLHVENDSGELPLIRAIRLGRGDVVEAFLQPDYRFIMVLQSKDHKTAYNLARELGDTQLAARLRSLTESSTDKGVQLAAVHAEYKQALAKTARALQEAERKLAEVTRLQGANFNNAEATARSAHSLEVPEPKRDEAAAGTQIKKNVSSFDSFVVSAAPTVVVIAVLWVVFKMGQNSSTN